MKKIKEIYSQPQCETLVVRFEGCLCTSPNGVGGIKNITSTSVVDDDEGYDG